jgi:hypothetical protein
MSRPGALTAALILAALPAASVSTAQDALSAKLDSSGLIKIARGELPLATVELNAHGPNWQHAPQETATGQISDLPGGVGKRVVGSLPVPTGGGAIRFIETVKLLPRGLQLEYDLSVSQTLRLNGLQLSILLPVTQYAGKEYVITRYGAEPEIGGFPEEQPTGFQLWSGEGARVEIDKGAPNAVTIQLRAATDMAVQDLRQWEHDIFEVRFPAIMEDGGRELSAEDRFHLDLTITFAEAVKLEG